MHVNKQVGYGGINETYVAGEIYMVHQDISVVGALYDVLKGGTFRLMTITGHIRY